GRVTCAKGRRPAPTSLRGAGRAPRAQASKRPVRKPGKIVQILLPAEDHPAEEKPPAEEWPQHAPQKTALAVVRVIGEQHVLDVFGLIDQEAVQKKVVEGNQVWAEHFRHYDWELILAKPPEELEHVELRGKIGVLDEVVAACRGSLFHARLLTSALRRATLRPCAGI